MAKIPEECIAWFCLLACIKNPDKCPEYYLSQQGIYEGDDTDKLQAEHYKWYLLHKDSLGGDYFD